MPADKLSCICGAQVDVGGFPSHGGKKLELIAVGGKHAEFDARTMRRQAADDPASAQLYKRIGTTHGTTEYGVVQDLRRSLLSLGPVNRRRDESLGLARDLGAMALRDSNQANVPKTSQTSDTPDGPVIEAALRHEMLKGLLRACGDSTRYSGQAIHLLPKMNRIAQYPGREFAQPSVILFEHVGSAVLEERFFVTLEDRLARFFRLQRQVTGCYSKQRTCRQPYQVDGIGQHGRFIEIIDPPYQPSLNVTPDAFNSLSGASPWHT